LEEEIVMINRIFGGCGRSGDQAMKTSEIVLSADVTREKDTRSPHTVINKQMLAQLEQSNREKGARIEGLVRDLAEARKQIEEARGIAETVLADAAAVNRRLKDRRFEDETGQPYLLGWMSLNDLRAWLASTAPEGGHRG
jgi:predicted phage gp36 major capsid-like protein